MNPFKTIAINHPVLFVLSLIIVWFVLLIIFMGIIASILRRPYGDAITGTIGRILVTTCCLLLIYELGWVEETGITQVGSWQVWVLTLGSMTYFASAALYSYYGKVDFDITDLIRSAEARCHVITLFVVAISEEILFRGIVLYTLISAWGKTTQGIIGSVVLTSLLFAVLHITQVFTHKVTLPAVVLLTIETSIISIWWGALVLLGGSLWPAIMFHFVVSVVVAVQGLTVSVIEPEVIAYRRILWFSIPLGVLGIVGLWLSQLPTD